MRPEVTKIFENIKRVLIGKDDVIKTSLVSLLAKGHLLIEDIPGIGKTTLAKSIAQSIGSSFKRIQFTSDLFPSDIIGVTIFNNNKNEFEFKAGPIFSNIILADEINRTTPRTQSSFLEAMQEGQVTVDSKTHSLPQPFMVIATQNGEEYQGTYMLPESQLDRFLLRIEIGYPQREDEVRIIKEKKSPYAITDIDSVISASELINLQSFVEEVYVEDSLYRYIVDIVNETRLHKDVSCGVSPRGTLALFTAAKANAFFEGRDYLIPDDIKKLSVSTLGHRMMLKDGSQSRDSFRFIKEIINEILSNVRVPV